jgi:hypothetical protein
MTRTTRFLGALLLTILAAACREEKLCSSDLVLCGDRCTALASDRDNCGACGTACGAGEKCAGGKCVCHSSTTCGGACADLASDPAHCGACDVACAGDLLCTTNDTGTTSCGATCLGTGQVPCGRACVNPATHVDNCGACGRACGSNESCVSGRCVGDLYLACFNSDEVRTATGALEAAGIPLAVAPGPIGLAWVGDLLAVASARPGGAETLAVVRFDLPGTRRNNVLETSAPNPDIQYLATHAGLLYLAHTSVGSVLVVTPGGTIVDEVRLAPVGDSNPNPHAIAFSGDKAYVALNARGQVAVLDVSDAIACALGASAPPCMTELRRIDVQPLASPGAKAMPSRIVVRDGRAFVTLWNLDDFFTPPPGSSGRLAVIDVATDTLDTTVSASADGLVDLGTGCLNPADAVFHGATLFVTCGAFDYSAFPTVTIHGNGIVPVDLSATLANVLPPIPIVADAAPGELAFCGTSGYVGDRNSGRVFPFDATLGTVGTGVELCPPSGGFAFVADLACGP